MTRTEFRQAILERDHNFCVICQNFAQDAHHIMERRLFPDGGYYLDNGAASYGDHHKKAEYAVLSCDKV